MPARRLAMAMALVAVGAALHSVPALAGPGDFDRTRLDVFGRELFDLGVADFDDDSDLDLFTTNHLARQSLLANDGSGQLSDRLYPSHLAQTPRLPGWDDPGRARGDDPGLYISHRRGKLLLRHAGGGRARGAVELLFPVDVGSEGRARARVRRDRRGSLDHFVARFTMRGDSTLRLDPERMAAPVTVSLAPPLPLSRVAVGALEAQPERRRFVLYLRDRHGMAWGDFGGDRDTDVFVVRGGLRGQITEVAGAIEDELRLGDGSRFADATARSGLRKGDCRGRSAVAVDANRDGRLDLLATCKKQEPKLYRQTAAGRFENASAMLARGGVDAWVMRWIDLDGRPGEEVVGVYARRFAVFRRREGAWQRRQLIPGRHAEVKGTLPAVGDFDADGDADLYVAAATGSTLLVNRGGRLDAQRPSRAGLPNRALAAAWTDYDNDADLDLHVAPAGLFSRQDSGDFDRVGLRTPENPDDVRVAWPDLDADGARDAVVSYLPRRSAQTFKTHAYFNEAPAGHWLEVDLVGNPANRQALGARVRVRSGGVRQTQWVGQNESSLYSQGHYRLYFGLAGATTADVEVRWPGGSEREIGPVVADQRLEIERAGG